MIQTIILAAGLSTRMRPLTTNTPKPMLQLAGKPILQHIIENLRDFGIVDIIITTHYLPWVIENHFGNGSKFGVKITYSYEKRLLDTAGSIKALEPVLEKQFLVCGGHFILPTINLPGLIKFHNDLSGVGTIVFKKLDELEHLKFFGQGILDFDQRLSFFAEKPKIIVSPYIHTTYQIFSREILRFIPKGFSVSIPDFLIPLLLSIDASLFGYITDSELINVSTKELYYRAKQRMLTYSLRKEMER